MQCHLECAPGFSPSLDPTVQCVGGRYVPHLPSQFTCTPSAAIIISSEGEVEVFSGESKCNKMIPNVPSYAATKHTVNVFNNKLLIAGYSLEKGTWSYISLEDPFSSMLSNSWNVNTTVGKVAPTSHTSYTYGHSLVLVGGTSGQVLKLDIGGNWNSFLVPWKNGTSFSSFNSHACGVRVSTTSFLVMGGVDPMSNSVQASVLMIDMEKEVVEELAGLSIGRAFHACELMDSTRVLVTGGRLTPEEHAGSIAPDEHYSLTTQVSQVLNSSMIIPRYNHRLVLLEDKVFAIGGRMANKTQVPMVEKYDPGTSSWVSLGSELLSHSVGELALTTLAQSALDCDVGCSCGQPIPRQGRILGESALTKVGLVLVNNFHSSILH